MLPDRAGRNLWHKSEITTEAHYGKVSEGRQGKIFDDLWQGNIETEEDKDLLHLLYKHQLTPGTPDYVRADKMSEQRRARVVRND